MQGFPLAANSAMVEAPARAEQDELGSEPPPYP